MNEAIAMIPDVLRAIEHLSPMIAEAVAAFAAFKFFGWLLRGNSSADKSGHEPSRAAPRSVRIAQAASNDSGWDHSS